MYTAVQVCTEVDVCQRKKKKKRKKKKEPKKKAKSSKSKGDGIKSAGAGAMEDLQAKIEAVKQARESGADPAEALESSYADEFDRKIAEARKRAAQRKAKAG